MGYTLTRSLSLKVRKYFVSLLFCFLPVTALASPYFRLLNLSSPVTSMEVLFNPNQGIDATQLGSFLDVVTHDPKDGCLIPAVCESWSPLEIGGAFTGPNKLFGLGPQANLAPWLKAGALAVLNGTTAPDAASGLKSFLDPANTGAFSFSLGAKWLIAPEQNWKGYFLLSAGPTLKW